MWTHYTENVWNSSHRTLRSLWHHLVVKLDYHWSFHLMKRTGLLVGITCSRVGHVTVPQNNLYFRCNFISDTWIRIDTWPWWFNSFKSQWNTVSYVSKTNNIQTRQTIRLLQNRIFYRIREILEEDGLNLVIGALNIREYPWKSTSSKWTYTFWTLYKETVHVSMFDWSDWDWMQLLVDFISTESKWIFAPPTMHFHSGHLKITSEV